MRISFQHANPDAGNESFLLRFDTGGDERPCVLVDAGHGVDLDRLLGPDDTLVAICLTHAHLDHYAELTSAHRDDAPVLTSPATAAILGDVFDVAAREYDVTTSTDVSDAIEPVDGWVDVAPNVDVHPVPAGHAPGAVGFLVRATDGDETHHILATGDFTTRRVAGFPGFDPEGFVEIDVLFLTVATNDAFQSTLTDALGTALEHAHGGAPTLVTSSGLVGVQVAYLLSALTDEYDLRVPVRVVGQVAKIYEALEYDCPGVETVPLFSDTGECLEPGTITVAGPEVPIERSSGRLFGVLRDDPNSCVVQLVGSGRDPIREGRCTIHSYELVNHPTRATLTDVHDAVDPTETVIVHRHGGAQGVFNDLGSVVWGSGDTEEYTLFDGTRWCLPPWMDGTAATRSRGRSVQQFACAELLASMSVPSVDRRTDPDLEAEGIDTAQISTLLHKGPGAAASLDAPGNAPNGDTPRPEDALTNATVERSGATDIDVYEDPQPMTDMYRTAGLDADRIDPAMRKLLEERDTTPQEFIEQFAARTQTAETQPTEQAEKNGGYAESSPVSDPADDLEAEDDDLEAEDDNLEADATEGQPTTDDTAGQPTEETTEQTESVADSASERHEGDHSDEPEAETAEAVAEADTEDRDDQTEATLLVNPLVFAIAARVSHGERGDDAGRASVDETIVEAVDEYVVALLAGEVSGSRDERVAVDISASPVVEQALDDVIDDDARFDSITDLVTAGVLSVLGRGTDQARAVDGLGRYRRSVEAIAQNERYAFEDATEVVEAAVLWFATAQQSE